MATADIRREQTAPYKGREISTPVPDHRRVQRNIANLLSDIAREKGAVTANRVRSSLCAFFGWAIREGVRLPEGNVASYTNKREESSRDRVLTDRELGLIWNACLDDDYGAILKLLMLTGQRANEIAQLRWNEVHDEQIVLPAERTKNAHSHVIPLSEPAKGILPWFREGRRTFVFGRDNTGFSGWGKAKEKLDARVSEVKKQPLEHWTVHDLRRTVATRMAFCSMRRTIATCHHWLAWRGNRISGSQTENSSRSPVMTKPHNVSVCSMRGIL